MADAKLVTIKLSPRAALLAALACERAAEDLHDDDGNLYHAIAAALRSGEETKALTVRMTLVGVTKGALRYQEIDADGNEVRQSEPSCVVGTLYHRQLKMKSLLGSEDWPQSIRVTLAYD